MFNDSLEFQLMNKFKLLILVFTASFLAGCATRPVNPMFNHAVNYDLDFKKLTSGSSEETTLAVLAFSGGGMRAAAFSYGVLETLKETKAKNYNGEVRPLLDYVDVVTGVSGGSFTALAYRMYGDELFSTYEKNFLKRDVQTELIEEALNPLNWGDLASDGWGRSEMAANLYDRILFKGKTFGDLNKTKGPFTVVSATDIQTGTRILFTRNTFNVLCSDLDSYLIARAAAASSAVPVVLSPLTINNYNGECKYVRPEWEEKFRSMEKPTLPVSRSIETLNQIQGLDSKTNPYLHLVDGGVSDNLGLKSVLDILNLLEALKETGYKTKLDKIDRIVVVIVNSLSEPKLNWNTSEDGPGTVDLMIRAAGLPIDNYSGEQIDQLKDISSRWSDLNDIKNTPEFKQLLKNNPNMRAAKFIEATPKTKIYAINVAFKEEKDKKIRDKLNNLPTSFVLQPEDVDMLRSSAKGIFLNSPDFKRLVNDVEATIIPQKNLKASNKIQLQFKDVDVVSENHNFSN